MLCTNAHLARPHPKGDVGVGVVLREVGVALQEAFGLEGLGLGEVARVVVHAVGVDENVGVLRQGVGPQRGGAVDIAAAGDEGVGGGIES